MQEGERARLLRSRGRAVAPGRTVEGVAQGETARVLRGAPAPMLATLGKAPVAGDTLATEFKWDGQIHWTCQPRCGGRSAIAPL
jgi:hypothetical protein